MTNQDHEVVECGNCGREIIFGHQCVCAFEKEIKQLKSECAMLIESCHDMQGEKDRAEKLKLELEKTYEDNDRLRRNCAAHRQDIASAERERDKARAELEDYMLCEEGQQ